MPIKSFKPTSAGRRQMEVLVRTELTASKPYKPLLEPKPHGRANNMGWVSAWQRGGGHKRRYRVIDFKRDKDGVPGTVTTIE